MFSSPGAARDRSGAAPAPKIGYWTSAADGFSQSSLFDQDRRYKEETLAALKEAARCCPPAPHIAAVNGERLQLGQDLVGSAGGALCRFVRLPFGPALVGVPFQAADESALIGQALPPPPYSRGRDAAPAAKVELHPCRAYASQREFETAFANHLKELQQNSNAMLSSMMLSLAGLGQAWAAVPAILAAVLATYGFAEWKRRHGQRMGMLSGTLVCMGAYFAGRTAFNSALAAFFPEWNAQIGPAASTALVLAGGLVMAGAALHLLSLKKRAPQLREPFDKE